MAIQCAWLSRSVPAEAPPFPCWTTGHGWHTELDGPVVKLTSDASTTRFVALLDVPTEGEAWAKVRRAFDVHSQLFARSCAMVWRPPAGTVRFRGAGAR